MGAAFDAEIEGVAAIVDVERRVDPVLAACDGFTVFPEQAVTGREGDNGPRPDDDGRVDNRISNDDSAGANGPEDNGGPGREMGCPGPMRSFTRTSAKSGRARIRPQD